MNPMLILTATRSAYSGRQERDFHTPTRNSREKTFVLVIIFAVLNAVLLYFIAFMNVVL